MLAATSPAWGATLDITALKEAEDQVAANLDKANSAWAEAEALREATLALTQDLHMDSVMDALLRSLAELVPYESTSGVLWLIVALLLPVPDYVATIAASTSSLRLASSSQDDR